MSISVSKNPNDNSKGNNIQNQQLQDMLTQLLTGVQRNNNPLISQGGYTVDQAKADSANLVNAAMRELQHGQLAAISRAIESAGGSGSALAALLANESTAAAAGQVAKQQGAFINTAVNDQTNRQQLDVNALLGLLDNNTNQQKLHQGLLLGLLRANQNQQQVSQGNIAPAAPTQLPSFNRPPLMGFHGPSAENSDPGYQSTVRAR